MSTASKVTVVGSDLRTAAALRFAFVRAGWDVGKVGQPTDVTEIAEDAFAALALLVIQSDDPSHARLLLSQAAARRAKLAQSPSVLFIGSGLSAVDAWQVGATEALAAPVYLRDVTVAAQLMIVSGDTNADGNGRKGGQLGDRLGAYQLIRAFGRMRRSGVVQLSRGLRRGEVRFYRGEVTSAHTGDLHGQAALHQLLLWTEGRFEYRLEDVVRRRQIPLSPDEIFADAEQFLLGVRDAAAGLSPPMVFASDATVQKQHSEKLPNGVLGVLRLFDGRRAMVDVLQDSPYRMFETLRVARKAVDAGLLKAVPPVAPTIPGATANARARKKRTRPRPHAPPPLPSSDDHARHRTLRLLPPSLDRRRGRPPRRPRLWRRPRPPQPRRHRRPKPPPLAPDPDCRRTRQKSGSGDQTKN